MENRDIVIDEQENWRAVIYFIGDDSICLGFETKPSGIAIQGNVDDALEDTHGYYVKNIGVEDLDMCMDDGFWVVYYGDCSEDKKQEVVPKIVDYLTALYNDNKKKFIKSIKADLKFYDKL